MKQTIRFGRVFGVEIGANWSLLVLILLVAHGLSTVVLPALAPGQSTTAYWTAGAVCGLLIAGSLLLHELAHSVVAVRAGLPVERITLWMLGGASVLGGEPASARAAFRIAAAGPLSSLGLGLAAGCGALALSALGAPELIVSSTWWLGSINVVLAVFNLLPGNPLDGGRILRAILWWRTGDPDRAEIGAARAGRVLGVVVTALGFAQWLSGQFAGLWLILVGLLIGTVAASESRAARMRVALGQIRVADVMAEPGVVAHDAMTVDQFLAGIVPGLPEAAYPVVDLDGRAAGTVELHSLVGIRRSLAPSTRIAEVRTPLEDVPLAQPTDLVADLAVRMRQDALALVTESDHRLVGVVSRRDVARLVQGAPLRPTGQEPYPA
ncbi:site-2 protease family protein [Kribbella sp. HUAS MG21]|jgi:Zn-dependent protease|uniref:Zinc metalloprotease n=1 Tax=Kribbella sp. HUAS MG21 TaxID=3160966 RepID=A0AAU7T7R8_9ACTN